jgi:hypothetical protein
VLFVEDLLAEEVFFLETFPPNTANPPHPPLPICQCIKDIPKGHCWTGKRAESLGGRSTFTLWNSFFGFTTQPQILEQLQQCSVCGPAKENWMKKSQNMPVWLSKMVLAQHVSTGC